MWDTVLWARKGVRQGSYRPDCFYFTVNVKVFVRSSSRKTTVTDLPTESLSRFLNAAKLPSSVLSSSTLSLLWRDSIKLVRGAGWVVAASCAQVVGRSETLSRKKSRVGMAKLRFCAPAFVHEAMPITSPRWLKTGLPLFPGEMGQES